ncbi:MbtH family protein [Erwinia endophytica]|uniref:MbtH family protein n=1 Tax=Erwinia endophytica TaxID=1563158 RepID=UPI0012660204|nr:MbtH family NRPS accessory protein [Erwinia endophytica]KAB8307391.1 MbtH family protein [Erwinia endophytica]
MEYSNPFDCPQGQFLILQNPQQQYSLWPQHCALPEGWRIISGPHEQQQCHDWLNQHWQQLIPASFAAPCAEEK